MSRFGMVIDTRRCVGCHDCVVACKTENGVPEGYSRDWISRRVARRLSHRAARDPLRALQSLRQSALRVSCCPTGASHVHERGGVVLVTHDKCIGCKACLAACPYDARFIHPDGYADKCTFCIHRVEHGLDPACVSVCPTHCMHFGDLDDPQSEVSRLLELAPASRALAGSGNQTLHLLSDVR